MTHMHAVEMDHRVLQGQIEILPNPVPAHISQRIHLQKGEIQNSPRPVLSASQGATAATLMPTGRWHAMKLRMAFEWPPETIGE